MWIRFLVKFMQLYTFWFDEHVLRVHPHENYTEFKHFTYVTISMDCTEIVPIELGWKWKSVKEQEMILNWIGFDKILWVCVCVCHSKLLISWPSTFTHALSHNNKPEIKIYAAIKMTKPVDFIILHIRFDRFQGDSTDCSPAYDQYSWLNETKGSKQKNMKKKKMKKWFKCKFSSQNPDLQLCQV